MTILFYYPFNNRTIPIDVPLLALKDRGHKVLLLTQGTKGDLHELYEQHGIPTFCHKSKTKPGQVRELISFCSEHKVDVIHSHLQQANLTAVLASLFMNKTKVVSFRHHCKFEHLIDKTDLKPSAKEIWADKIINRLAQKIVVPATAVKTSMIEKEGVNPEKIVIIPYIYHFDKMSKIDRSNSEKIRQAHQADLIAIMVSRLTPYKRHIEALKPIASLIKSGYDIQLLIMDTGPELESLKAFIKEENIQQNIHFLGFQRNILEYISAADILIHPSLTDASNSAVKEAGLFEKTVIVCDQVGDFNDYIIHEENGFLLPADKFSTQCEHIVKTMIANPTRRKEIGTKLRDRIIEKFSYSEDVVTQYENL